MYKIIDYITKKEVTAEGLIFVGDNPWEVVMDLSKIKQNLDKKAFLASPPSYDKYLPFLPVENRQALITLDELATPLIPSKRLGPERGLDLDFKVEGYCPSGSYKDRGSALEVSIAKANNAHGIILASTGNMAASCACYAAVAQLRCIVIVPNKTPLTKLAQAIAYGGHIVQVDGTYNDAERLAVESAKAHGFYLAGDYAFRVEGQKTAAFELCDQLAGTAPDIVFIPIGCGTNLAAYAKGFKEYKELGLCDKVPKLIGVEATGANAVVRGFEHHAHEPVPVDNVDTIASAIAIHDPIDGRKALDAIYETGGEALEVTDQEILQARHMLACNEGLFIESSGAATFAALQKYMASHDVSGKKIVCVLTGHGLKDSKVIFEHVDEPPIIEPTLEAFNKLYNSTW